MVQQDHSVWKLLGDCCAGELLFLLCACMLDYCKVPLIVVPGFFKVCFWHPNAIQSLPGSRCPQA